MIDQLNLNWSACNLLAARATPFITSPRMASFDTRRLGFRSRSLLNWSSEASRRHQFPIISPDFQGRLPKFRLLIRPQQPRCSQGQSVPLTTPPPPSLLPYPVATIRPLFHQLLASYSFSPLPLPHYPLLDQRQLHIRQVHHTIRYYVSCRILHADRSISGC